MVKRPKVSLFVLGAAFFTSLATGETAVVKNSTVQQAVRKANDGLSIGQAKDAHKRANKIRKHSENSASSQNGSVDPCENADPSNASEQCNEKQLNAQAAAEEAKRAAEEARKRAEEERKKAEEEARRKQEQANNATNQAAEAVRHLIP